MEVYILVMSIRSLVLFAGTCFLSPIYKHFTFTSLLYSFVTSRHLYLYMNFGKILKVLGWHVSIDFF